MRLINCVILGAVYADRQKHLQNAKDIKKTLYESLMETLAAKIDAIDDHINSDNSGSSKTETKISEPMPIFQLENRSGLNQENDKQNKTITPEIETDYEYETIYNSEEAHYAKIIQKPEYIKFSIL